jgi:hypothetical protein
MHQPQAFDPANRRGGVRQRVLLSGKIVQRDGAFSTDCAIRDLSEEGAKLRLPAPVPVGEDFYLIEMRSGRIFHADIKWRKAEDLGVSFRHPDPIDDPASKDHRLLRRLWLDTAWGRPL